MLNTKDGNIDFSFVVYFVAGRILQIGDLLKSINDDHFYHQKLPNLNSVHGWNKYHIIFLILLQFSLSLTDYILHGDSANVLIF